MKFSEKTINTFKHLKKKGYITDIVGPIKEGKESMVYYSKTGHGNEVAVKLYLYESSMFKNMSKYVDPDTRFFTTKRKRRTTILNWVRKEFFNLKRARGSGLTNVPKPIRYLNNVLVMNFIGSDGMPASLLKDYHFNSKKEEKKILQELKVFIKDLYQKAGLVHADLSEYNVLMHAGMPFVIDFSSAITANNLEKKLEVLEFLRQDIKKVYTFFRNKGLNPGDEEEFLQEVVKNVSRENKSKKK